MAGIDPISNLPPELQRVYHSAIAAEKKPLDAMNSRKTDIGKKVELLNDVMGKIEDTRKVLSGLTSPGSFRELIFKSGDEKIVTGTVNKDIAEPGTHNIDVVQLASRATALTNGFEDKNEARVGTGYIVFRNTNGETKEIFVDDDNSTLEGLAKTINKAKAGIHASVVQDNSDPEQPPYKLLLSADKTGEGANVEYPEFYLIDGDQELTVMTQKDAANAIIKYEGMESQFPNNQINDLISGVSLDLKGVTEPGRPVSINVEDDVPKIKGKIKDFVDKMNSVFGFIQTQSKMDKDTNAKQTLGGEYSIRMADMRLKEALQPNFLNDPTKKIKGLGDMGIQFNKKGTLDFDEKKLEHALSEDLQSAVEFLSGDVITPGVMPKIESVLSSLTTQDNGVLSVQRSNLKMRQAEIDKQIFNKEKQVEKKAETLKENLAKTQGALQALQGQQQYMNSQIPLMMPQPQK